MSRAWIARGVYSTILTITISSASFAIDRVAIASQHEEQKQEQENTQDYYIVCLKKEYKDEIYRVMETLQQRDDFQGEILPLLLIKGFASHLSQQAKEWLESLEEVDFIELDGKVETQQLTSWKRQVVSDLLK